MFGIAPRIAASQTAVLVTVRDSAEQRRFRVVFELLDGSWIPTEAEQLCASGGFDTPPRWQRLRVGPTRTRVIEAATAAMGRSPWRAAA